MTYSQNLILRALDLVVAAAQSGWGPHDLLHVLGRKVHPLLYRAAPRVPSQVTNASLRREWLRLGPPESLTVAADDVEEIVAALYTLRTLKDAELLGQASAEQGLSEVQVKARKRIEGLLRKAESTQFEDEADALIAKAQVLRQRYRITEALADESVDIMAGRVRIAGPWVKHQFCLLGAVARANGAATLLLDDRGIATVFGGPADVEHVKALFDSLNRQCAWFMKNGPQAESARRRGQTAAYRRSFRLAYAARIAELLHAANKTGAEDMARTQDSPAEGAYEITSRALPVLARRQSQAEESRDRLFPNLSTMSLSMTNQAGVLDGIDAAQRSNLAGDSRAVTGRRELAS